jgi:hypothetical protein
MPYGKRRTFKRKGTALSRARRTARKPVDKNQNKAILALSKRLKKLETTTVERKYLTMTDAFSFGGTGQVKSRCLHRYRVGTYDGMTTSTLFGTNPPQGDYVYAKYMIVDVELQCQNPNALIADEVSPTTFSIYLLKQRKENDRGYLNGWYATNGLNNTEIITHNAAGQCFVNPKGFKIVKTKIGVIGGISAENNGFGVAHRRYRFKIPLNKKVMLQTPGVGDDVGIYPMEEQDWLYFAISANGSVADGAEPHCSLSCLLCYDDAGEN